MKKFLICALSVGMLLTACSEDEEDVEEDIDLEDLEEEPEEEEDIFSPEYFEKLSDVKMPATKLELLVKMLRKQIKDFREQHHYTYTGIHKALMYFYDVKKNIT